MEVLQADECYKFLTLLKEVPMGHKDAVLANPLLENHSVECLKFEESSRKPYIGNLCLFRALALHCMETRDSSRKLLDFSIFCSEKLVGLILQTFEVFVWKILQ